MKRQNAPAKQPEDTDTNEVKQGPGKQPEQTDCMFEIRSSWEVTARPRQIFEVLQNPMSILIWWSSVFMDGDELSQGANGLSGFRARFHTKGLMPHSFQFVAEVTQQTATRLVIRTEGDFDGVGVISIRPQGAKMMVDVEWQVIVHQPYIKPFLRRLKPVFEWNHLWAMRQGRLGLEKYLAQEGRANEPILRPSFPHNFLLLRRPFKWRY